MYKFVVLLAVFVLLFGCMGNNTPDLTTGINTNISINSSNSQNLSDINPQDYLKLSENGNVETAALLSINQNGKVVFPFASDYAGQFDSLGLYSDYFIHLNRSQFKLLNENESIWITPGVTENGGLLFNAIYSTTVYSCTNKMYGSTPPNITILGKQYPYSLVYQNGSSFEKDDKWKVRFEQGTNCTGRLIIYLDGYFDKLTSKDQISLFRNDNTVLVQFVDLDTQPKMKVILSKAVNSASIPSSLSNILSTNNSNFSESGNLSNSSDLLITQNGSTILYYNSTNRFYDNGTGNFYTIKQTSNENGLEIDFYPSISVLDVNDEYSDSSHHFLFKINNQSWVITKLRKTNGTGVLSLGKEITYDELFFPTDNFKTNALAWNFSNAVASSNPSSITIFLTGYKNGISSQNNQIELRKAKLLDGVYVYAWYVAGKYSGGLTGFVSTFSAIADLNDSNSQIVWEENGSQPSRLKSISIPVSSSSYSILVSK
ncbi:hypothetical protein HZC07_01670 [Candidatus Micrarchaeota archaeon]|nr:hypothetical protein [Candidatus Micrarchaeota archaeon]